MNDFGFTIDVPVRTEWRNVTLLVTSVQNCYSAMFGANIDGSHTIAMVTGELLENAIKYGAWAGEDVSFFRLNVGGHDNVARIIVQNPAEEQVAQELMATLKWIKSFDKPDEAYRAKLLEIANTAPSAGVSKLGLVRIVYEADCTIDATYDNGIVRVTAELKV